MKRIIAAMLVVMILICCCACSGEAIMDFIYSFEFEFACEFDLYCSEESDFSEFERAISVLGGTVKEKKATDDQSVHYTVVAPWKMEEYLYLIPAFRTTILAKDHEAVLLPEDVTKCSMQPYNHAGVELSYDLYQSIYEMRRSVNFEYEGKSELVYFKFDEEKQVMIISVLSSENRLLICDWVLSMNEIRFNGTVEIDHFEERKTKQEFRWF